MAIVFLHINPDTAGNGGVQSSRNHVKMLLGSLIFHAIESLSFTKPLSMRVR